MNVLDTVKLTGFGKKQKGKVRDWYTKGQQRILITTDRISAFDRVLGLIPYKGQVLNQLANFWFDQTKDIIKNHIIALPDPNVTIAHLATPIPIEMVVRGYITGVTITSLWGSYEKGERTIYGIQFPDGLKKNDKLPHPVLTPTTKAESGHDERITKQDIITRKIVSKKIYEQMEQVALALFSRGQTIAAKHGILLVDTKYEFGLYKGQLMLIDEIHTPDSSRYWIQKTYKQRTDKGQEPENFDKEFLRLWYAKQGYRGDGKPPAMTPSFIADVSKRYIDVYDMLAGKNFLKADTTDYNMRIQNALTAYYGKL